MASGPGTELMMTTAGRPPGAAMVVGSAMPKVIPKRPKGIPAETDVQVELVDGRGEVTRFRDSAITWR